jgi:hypothetical protein
MNLKQKFADLLLAMLAVAGIAGIVYLFSVGILDKLNSVNSELTKASIGAVVAVFVAAVTIVLGKAWELKTKIKQEIREKKIPVYEKQLEAIFATLFSDKLKSGEGTGDDLLKAFIGFSEKIVIWGDSEVISSWEQFRRSFSESASLEKQMAALEDFILALRKDVGNSNKSLKRGDILRAFLNDVDKAKIG